MYNPDFNLRITDLPQARKLLQAKWPTWAVTLLGPTKPWHRDHATLWSTGDNHVRIVVDDITESWPGWEACTHDHVRELLAWADNIKAGNNVLIHCRAGVSRSTAASIAVLVSRGANPRDAIDYVQRIRPILDPNELILTRADEVLGLQGALVEAYADWADVQTKSLFNFIPRGRDHQLATPGSWGDWVDKTIDRR